MQKKIHALTIETIQGDIAAQEDIEAVVNAANAQLKTGGGVAGAIHRTAGPELEKECRQYAPIRPGEAVLSKAYNLPNDYVIHCLGPVYGKDKPEDELLSKCYRNALKRAEEKNITSIAFPAISAGAFGYPLQEASRIALQTIAQQASSLKSVRLVRFVLFKKSDQQAFEKELQKLEKA